MACTVVRQTHIPEVKVRRGKVRDIYDLGDQLLLVATDRISAFDCVLPDPIPNKGRVLTALTKFWFDLVGSEYPHHLIEVIGSRPPKGFEAFADQLAHRTMVCRKTKVVPIECVARGYLSGSGWKEYLANGTVCGIALPAGCGNATNCRSRSSPRRQRRSPGTTRTSASSRPAASSARA